MLPIVGRDGVFTAMLWGVIPDAQMSLPLFNEALAQYDRTIVMCKPLPFSVGDFSRKTHYGLYRLKVEDRANSPLKRFTTLRGAARYVLQRTNPELLALRDRKPNVRMWKVEHDEPKSSARPMASSSLP